MVANKTPNNGHKFNIDVTHKVATETLVGLWVARLIVVGFFAGVIAWAGSMVWLALWVWSHVFSYFQ